MRSASLRSEAPARARRAGATATLDDTGGWRFLDRAIALAIHEHVLAAHGGAVGLLSEESLSAALRRPVETARKVPRCDAARLAAACAAGFIRSHPFVEGKKRVALVALELFLVDNGYSLDASDEECFVVMAQFAAREIDEEALADWVRTHIPARRRAGR